MIRIYLFGLFGLFIIGVACTTNPDNNLSISKDAVAQSNDTLNEISKTLTEELNQYKKENEAIENPWNAPTLLFVTFSEENSDTVVSIFSHIGLIEFINQEKSLTADELKGYYLHQNQPVIVYNLDKEKDFTRILNFNLKKENIRKHDFFATDTVEMVEWKFKPEIWKYKVRNDSLFLLSKE